MDNLCRRERGVRSLRQKENPFEPFTADEFIRAFRLVVSDDEARRLEQALADSGIHTPATIGWGWTDDLLLLLSVESEELRLKVERFRREDLHMNDPDEQKEWENRRAVLKEWLESKGRIKAENRKPPDVQNDQT